MNAPRAALLLALAAAAARPAAALELALEGFKQERGIVGFVDMRRVYEAYPETRKQKEAFDLELRKRQKALDEQQAKAQALKVELNKLDEELSKFLSEPVELDSAALEGTFSGITDLPGLDKALTPRPVPKAPPPPPPPAKINPYTFQSPESFARLKQVEADLSRKKGLFASSQSDLKGLEKRLELEKEITRMKGERGLAAWGRAAEMLQEIMKLYPEEGGRTLADISIPDTVKAIKNKKNEIESLPGEIAELEKERARLAGLPVGEVPKPLPPPPQMPQYESGISTAAIAKMIEDEAAKRAEQAGAVLKRRAEAIAAHVKRLHELEEGLDQKRVELAAAKDALQSLGVRFGKELLEIEDNKTLTLLASLYKLTRELAVEEKAVMVVDKANILFGSQSVDLTEKLLARLRVAQQ